MRTVICEAFGPPASLREVDVERPVPGRREVLARVEATGIGFVDGLTIQGKYQVKPWLPHYPGSEFAGTVEAIGDDVTEFAPGDAVFGTANGALADYVCTGTGRCHRTPAGLGAAQAASLYTNYLTAVFGLRDRGHLRSGETLLVLGAAGGVGTAAIAVAKAMGARVIGAASTPDKRATAEAAGADATVDYSRDDWRDALRAVTPEGLNVVYDPVGGDVAEPAFRSLAPGGRFLVVGFASGTIPRLPLNLALLKRSAVVGVDWGGEVRARPGMNAELAATLIEWIEEDRLRVAPVTERPASEYVRALEDQLAGRILGKLVLAR
ncbi:MAG: NADPH:quinone oxidoreductase family protein [Gammaproteobacteria bacterium]|nr:NADPH:quinone oxidoreductase family protein [Gammaproteobacteria bacterium]